MITPRESNALDMALGPKNIHEWLPDYATIPAEFKRFSGNKWVDIVSHWFFQGLPAGTVYKAKPGIDGAQAMAHAKVCLSSWEPKHEHKTAGVAYLLSEWFDDIKIPK